MANNNIIDTSVEQQRKKSDSVISVDFETAITQSGFGKFNVIVMLLALPVASASTFVSGSTSYLIPAASHYLQLTSTEKAFLQSAGYAGMICGGFVWGFLSDTFGRKYLIASGLLLDFFMNTMLGLFAYLPSMLVFKYLSGFMVCGPFSILTAYISEVFDSRTRDIAVLAAGMCTAIGNIILVALAMVTIPLIMPTAIPLQSWQLFQLLCGLPSLFCGIAFLFCVESPKYLVDRGNTEAALNVCRTIYTINTGNEPSTYPVKRLHHQVSKTDTKETNWSRIKASVDIFKTPFIQRAIFFFIIIIGQTSTNNGMWLWLPEILTLVQTSTLDTNLGLCPLIEEGKNYNGTSVAGGSSPGYTVYTDMMLVNVASLAGHIVFMVAVKFLGKKTMLVTSALITAFCAISIPMVSADYAYLPASAFLSFNSMIYYANISIVVSVFPTRLRATSVSLTLLIGRMGVLVANFIIAQYIYTYCRYYFYTIAAVAIGIVTVGLFLSQKPIDKVRQSTDRNN